MSDWYMNEDACLATLSQIKAMKDSLTQQLATVSASVDNTLNGGWISPGANLFSNEYQTWRSEMTSVIEELTTYSGRLEKEIAEWRDFQATA